MAIAKKKKRFFDVDMPVINRQTQLQAMEIKELDGRFIKYDLTRILKGKSTLITLKVKTEDERATSTPISLQVLQNSLKNMVRKGTDYIEDSFQTECENAIVTIKPLLVSRRRISRVVRKALRERAKTEIIEYVKNKTAEDLIAELLRNQLQKTMSLKLKKVYPLSLCEVRTFKIEKQLETKEKKTSAKKEEKVEKQVEETAKE